MVEVLEAMGFPSEWCERALKSTSGLETAVDLLLQWQAQGIPQYSLPSSVRPSSSPLRSPSSSSGGAGTSVLQPQQQVNSLPGSSAVPTLRLQPLPSQGAASRATFLDEREQSPSSTLLPSASSPCPSSVDGPPGLNPRSDSERPAFPRTVGLRNDASAGRIGPSENNPVMATTGNSGVEGVARATAGRGCAGSSRTVHNGVVECSDAVVPDAYAEERKARYAAARRAKQEKEQEKARIRQHMQEDMALRRFRHSYLSAPDIDRNKSSSPAGGKRSGGGSSSRAVSKDTVVELQIRCPRNQNLKASFPAGATLKDVRAYVDNQLQQPLRVLGVQDHFSELQRESTPLSGQSSRLSSDRQAERELLQAARENFEIQTSRILASAKSLRAVSGLSQNSSGDILYFLIPFPRQEFFTESAMETTLAQAQLVPRGTLVVHYKQSELESAKSVQARAENSGSIYANESVNNIHHASGPETAVVSMVAERPTLMEVESDTNQVGGVASFEDGSPYYDSAISETMNSRRTLEVEGERVRARERALQAAAKRMSEAARIFRAGLPLGEGETGEAFHFPRDTENQNMVTDALEKAPEGAAPLSRASVPPPPAESKSMSSKQAGANAEQLDASSPTDEHPLGRDNKPDGRSIDRSRNALQRQAVAAAEGRMRNSQAQTTLMGGGSKQDVDESESRIGQTEVEAYLLRSRARIPQSSRLLSRPEKLQRTSDGSCLDTSPTSPNINAERQMTGGSNRPRQPQLSIGAASRAATLEAALQRCKALSDSDNKGKAIIEENAPLQVALPSSSAQVETERNSTSLRIRLEDGNVVLHNFPTSTVLRAVRDSVVPEGTLASEYGFVVPFPEPHFVEGDALGATLEEAGLVSRGTIHLTKLATRGMVRQGRRVPRRRRYLEESDDEEDYIRGMIRHLRERIDDRPDLSYEELMELEDNIGRVNVGVPEEVIRRLPTHIVKANETATDEEAEPDLCIVCMAEMGDGEDVLSLPCSHNFHTLCIRQWLLQSTCCPTCKQALV